MKSIKLDKPHALMMIGAPGSGKTVFAQRFAETFHAPLIDREWIATRSSDEENAKELFYYQLTELTKTEQFLVIDGCDRTATERSEVARALARTGYKVKYAWMQTDQPTCYARLLKKYRQSGTKQEVITYSKQILARYRPIIRTTDVIVMSGRHTFAAQAKTILSHIAPTRPAPTARPMPERTMSPERPLSSSRIRVS